jgi:hypothetical protein
VKQLLEEWRSFWPLNSNLYSAKDATGRLTPMPAGVEVGINSELTIQFGIAQRSALFWEAGFGSALEVKLDTDPH